MTSDLAKVLAGKFIVLDGTEGCGKSTQARLLKEAAEQAGARVLAVRDPGSTPVGEKIRGLLLDTANADMNMRCEMLLYMAARAQMMADFILPALANGTLVICDRFVSSTLSYQLGGDGLSAADIRATAEVAIRGRWPDLTIVLDLPADRSLARVTRARDRIEQRPMSYHEQVRRNYQAQAQADPRRCRIISADQEIPLVHAAILSAITSLDLNNPTSGKS